MTIPFPALAAAAAAACGLMAGVFFAFWSFVMPALAALDAPRGVAAMNAVNAAAVRPLFMTAFFGTGVACAAAAVAGLRGPAAVRGAALAAAVLYVAGVIGTTALFSQPLNLRLGALDPASAVAFWPRYLVTWRTANLVRTFAAGAAGALLARAALR